jgi:prolyl oligopeptidase PreP (S9A serine peptidase family)
VLASSIPNTRALVELPRVGSDATVVHEFDLTTRQFVPRGFTRPEAETHICWEDENRGACCQRLRAASYELNRIRNQSASACSLVGR